jgi:hypothetical protein
MLAGAVVQTPDYAENGTRHQQKNRKLPSAKCVLLVREEETKREQGSESESESERASERTREPCCVRLGDKRIICSPVQTSTNVTGGRDKENRR